VALRYDIPARGRGTVHLETVLYGEAMVRPQGSVVLRVTAFTKDSGDEVFAIGNNRMGEAIAQCVIQQSCGCIVLNIVEHFHKLRLRFDKPDICVLTYNVNTKHYANFAYLLCKQ
jgi:hypothetical protein